MRGVDVGWQDVDIVEFEMGDVFGETVFIVYIAIHGSGKEFERVVCFEEGGLVADDGVTGGMTFVEGIF